jgi:hypothetical protein
VRRPSAAADVSITNHQPPGGEAAAVNHPYIWFLWTD